MRNGLLLTSGVLLLVFLGVGLIGCGQSVPEVKSINWANNNLTLVGTVYEYNMDLTQKPVAGAIISLVGKETKTTTSGSDGRYNVSGITTGVYTIIVTKEGYQTYFYSSYSIATTYDNYTCNQNINLVNQPIILSITPSNGAIVPANLSTIIVEFNEPMDPTSAYGYVNFNRISAAGLSAAGLSGTTNSWSNNNRTLTITLSEPLTKEGMYNFYLVGPDGNYTTIRDASKNVLTTTYSSGAMFNTTGSISTPQGNGTAIVTNFFTSTLPAITPGKPTGLRIFDKNGSGDIDYPDVKTYNTDYLVLTWNATTDATAYKVYGSYAEGPYQQLYVAGYGYMPFNATGGSLYVYATDNSIANLTRVGNETSLINPVDPGTPWPFLGSGISLEVAAVSAFGETRSDPITAKDNVKPTVGTATVSGTIVTVTFSEPLNRAVAENAANYVLSDGAAASTVTSAVLVNNYSTPALTTVRLTLNPAAPAGTVTVQSGVTDLSSNIVDASANHAHW